MSDETEESYFSFLESGLTFVFEVDGTTVVASANVPEDEAVRVLRSLAPIELARQPVRFGR